MDNKIDGHINFYKKHNVSPVNYNIDLNILLEQRKSLYKGIGITPLLINNKNILEIAAGSGQNSIYLSINNPNKLKLIEPNPIAVLDIKNNYGNLILKHTLPEILGLKFEDFNSKEFFHIVICENWLGSSNYERKIRQKCMSLVDDNGLFVTTVISPIGILPNILRRYLATRLTSNINNFEYKISILEYAFDNHLNTLKSKNRSNRDWIIDNMLHPVYLNIVTTLPELLNDSAENFTIFKTWPSFNQDWRWFKSLNSNDTNFNEHIINEYYKWSHSFIYYNYSPLNSSIILNKILEDLCLVLINKINVFESNLINKINNKIITHEIDLILIEIKTITTKIYPDSVCSMINEGVDLCLNSQINIEDIKNSEYFINLFGRETIYVSIEKN